MSRDQLKSQYHDFHRNCKKTSAFCANTVENGSFCGQGAPVGASSCFSPASQFAGQGGRVEMGGKAASKKRRSQDGSCPPLPLLLIAQEGCQSLARSGAAMKDSPLGQSEVWCDKPMKMAAGTVISL